MSTSKIEADLAMGWSLQVEVNVAAFVMTPEGLVSGGNVVDTTLGFAARVVPPAREPTDRETNESVAHVISPVLAAVRLAVASLGFVYVGDLPEKIGDLGMTDTGESVRSDPVTVLIPIGDQPEHKA